jgi:DNA-binding NtrC family response regulator
VREADKKKEGGGHVASVPRQLADRIASTRAALLVTGETGVGKGYLAKWVHDHSPRREGPFLPVNCGAIPDGVIDSHLFGHTRGSFSDAHRDHLGVVRAAERGTLFLDEVGELPMKVQIRLLRLLEEREVQPVGSARPLSVNVRVIAATGCDLDCLVDRGAFRQDLFYRLNVIHMQIAPLRQRPQEIPELVEEFNREYAVRIERTPLEFEAATIRAMMQHPWPGNVRQLRTVIERLHVLCPTSVVTPAHLRTFGQLEMPARRAPGLRLDETRLQAMRTTLELHGGNISRAALALGVHRSTIHRWLARERLSA